jgi:hypothetical protein
VSQPIIFVRGNISDERSSDLISGRILESTGKEPVFVQGPKGRGMNLLMFVPIQ